MNTYEWELLGLAKPKKKNKKKKKEPDAVDLKIEQLVKRSPDTMLELYKKTLKEQRPFWKKQRRDFKKANQLPSDVMWEARKFSEAYRKPFRQPYGQIEEMFRQATDESTL